MAINSDPPPSLLCAAPMVGCPYLPRREHQEEGGRCVVQIEAVRGVDVREKT